MSMTVDGINGLTWVEPNLPWVIGLAALFFVLALFTLSAVDRCKETDKIIKRGKKGDFH